MRIINALKKEDERRALYATIVFIFLMILFFLLASLEVPDPPLEEKIIEIEMEFGSDYSGGSVNSKVIKSDPIPEPVKESAIQQETQEDESPVIVTSGKGSSKTSTNTKEPDPEPVKPKVDNGLAFPGAGTSGSGTGSGKGFGEGEGVGQGGNGNQNGAGDGTVNKSRKILSKGQVPGNSQEEGKIALDLYVNQFGKVVRTKFNAPKSTTGSEYLKNLAIKNAKTYKYEPIPGSPDQFVGTVVFTFRKQ